MSQLYKEAILEAKKLREVAETDAKNKIIEAVSPIIKKMITKEATEASKYLFGEEDSLTGETSDPLTGTSPDDLSSAVGPDVPGLPPISPSGELGGMPMPDDEGKITLDFQQLFSMSGGMTPSATASPVENPLAPGMTDAQTLPNVPADMSAPINPAPAPIESPVVPGAGMGTEIPGQPQAGQEIPVAPPAGTQLPTANPEQQLAQNPEEEEVQQEVPPQSLMEAFKNDVVLVAEKIDIYRLRENPSKLVKESIKNNLFSLYESMSNLCSKGILDNKKAHIVENKLEFLYEKLNEGKLDNSYREEENKKMTTLKEFAAKLFEEDALGPATADKATAHAKKESGVAPGVDLFKEGDKEAEEMKAMAESLLGEEAPASSAFGDGKVEGQAETASSKVHDASALAKKEGAKVVEESAPASTAFGDGEKASGAETVSPKVHADSALADEPGDNTILEFDEKELREAIAKVRKENLSRKIAAVKESAKGALGAKTDKDGHLVTPKVPEGDQGSAKPEGGKNPALKNLKEESLSLVPDMEADDMGGGDDEVELSFQIDVDDLEALLSGGVADFIAEPSSEEVDMPAEVTSSDSDDEIEVVDDETPEGDEGLLLDKETEEQEKEEMSSLMESKKANKVLEQLKSQLNESRLLTAKALYVSKFAVSNELSSKQKQKIAEYFDKAKTLAEAKETYLKIKKILSENVSSSSNLLGSASKPTTTGSARVLEEGVQKGSPDTIEAQRWMLLAGIKTKK